MSKNVWRCWQMILIRSNSVRLGLFYTKILWEFILMAPRVLYWFSKIFDKHVKNQFRLDGSKWNFMIKTTVIVKNCLDLILEGLRRYLRSIFWLFFHPRCRPLLKRGLMVFVRVDQHSSTLTTDQIWFLAIFNDFGRFLLISISQFYRKRFFLQKTSPCGKMHTRKKKITILDDFKGL